MRALALRLVFVASVVTALGCAQGSTISNMDSDPPCTPFETRSCPCIGGGSGTQTCARSGLAFGTCRGCAAGAVDGDGGTSLSTFGDADAFDPRVPQLGSVCGVGLPLLCAPQREKCCTRSLSVDTCVADDIRCACDLPECEVVEVRCDGPEDCMTGEVCCGTLEVQGGGGARYTSFACAAQCTTQQNLACHERGEVCPAGLLCTDSQLIPNVQICVDPASLQ